MVTILTRAPIGSPCGVLAVNGIELLRDVHLTAIEGRNVDGNGVWWRTEGAGAHAEAPMDGEAVATTLRGRFSLRRRVRLGRWHPAAAKRCDACDPGLPVHRGV